MGKKAVIKHNLTIILVILSGIISWSLTTIKSGLIYPFGMGFWGANGHDGVWHIALINSLAGGSFSMPVFSGSNIKNYHLGFDLFIAFFHNITKIPTVNLYFQIFPPLIASLVGISCYLFVYEMTKSKIAVIWSLFLIYFGGDISWILGKGESSFWSQQSISTLINPPFALSLILIFLGLYFLLKKNSILAIVFFGLLLETKAYAGLMVLGSLALAGTWQAIKEKKTTTLKVFVGSLLLSLIIFFMLNQGTENLFVFEPFWFLKNLFNSDRLSIPRLASAIDSYNLSRDWLKLGPAYILAFGIFWTGNMWTRLLKELEIIKWIKNPKKISYINVFFISMILGGAAIPMLFLQKGTPWNTIQFFYYSLIFSGILAGVAISNLGNSKIYKLITPFIIIFTLPTTLITLSQVYIPPRPPAKISQEELTALDFLSKQPQGVVLTYPFDEIAAKESESNPPRPLYLYDSTAYVSAFTNHQTFLEDQVNLNITNFDWQSRRNELINNFLNTSDQKIAREFMLKNNIKYIYWVKPQSARLNENQLGITKIFENKEVNIYIVNNSK